MPETSHELAPLAEALAVLGDRWSLLVVAALLDGSGRFGELAQRLPGIAPNILSQRLRSLESQGLLVATPYSTRPPRFLYELTDAGRELAGTLRLLSDWGGRHGGGTLEPPRHAACDTPLEVRWYCPTCEEPVPDPAGEPEELYFA
jgi:DNA-binding HxlR family transcriptional regulator